MRSTDLKIAYIGGGSRAWAWTFMTDLALEPDLVGVISLYDIDVKAAQNNEKIGNRLSAVPGARGQWKYKTAASLQDALTGANFVIISILPGTFTEMKSDVHLPERLGIYQSVGDTAGPGGAVRALRTVPAFVQFAEAIRDYAPNAWVINYTNPMSICVRTLYHTFPQIKAFGCCHEVFGMQTLLADVVRLKLGVSDVKRDEIHVNVLGLNHFTWFNRASFREYDLFALYPEFIDEYFETGYSADTREHLNKVFKSRNRVKFDLFRRYGWMAAAGDRHLAEFMPGTEYLKDPETVESWDFHLTTVDWRMEDLKQRLVRSEKLASGEQEISLDSSGEEGILLIKALCGLTRIISNVNLPNTGGQIGNLPKDAVVETNAVFSHDSVIPVLAGELSDELHALMEPHALNQADTLTAALLCDKELLYRVFERDPLIRGSKEEIRKLADDMIENTRAYLPAGW